MISVPRTDSWSSESEPNIRVTKEQKIISRCLASASGGATRPSTDAHRLTTAGPAAIDADMPRRQSHQMRPVVIIPHYLVHPEGSALVAFGDTQVICTASVEERLPPWLQGKGRGWVTAEYDMLPRATHSRNARDSQRGKINGRTQEISRLIGRSLRSVVDLPALGERMLTVDCDVIQADGGTRTAAITGGYVALALAIKHLEGKKKLKGQALKGRVAAVSVGILEAGPQLDLDYGMDSRAQVDMNVVMNGEASFIEVQGTGEGASFSRAQLDALLDLALGALPELSAAQDKAIATPYSAQGGALAATGG
jgi:ribonuclease PH